MAWLFARVASVAVLGDVPLRDREEVSIERNTSLQPKTGGRSYIESALVARLHVALGALASKVARHTTPMGTAGG
jgi:hypothetical protein